MSERLENCLRGKGYSSSRARDIIARAIASPFSLKEYEKRDLEECLEEVEKR